MKNTFDEVFDEWLWNKKREYNPFTRMFVRMAEKFPKVPEVEMPKLSKYRYNPNPNDFNN